MLSLMVCVVRISISLFFIWLTFGWKARKARKTFEKELIASGMPKEYAKRLSKQYMKMKKDMVSMFRQSVFSGGRKVSFDIQEYFRTAEG